MGGAQSKLKVEIVDRLKEYPYRNGKAISEEEFASEIFHGLDLSPLHEPVGPMFISGTHIIQLYYKYLLSINRGPFSKSKAISSIEELYSDPKKAIECSFRMMLSTGDTYISKDQFIDFVLACFDKGVQKVVRHTKCPAEFKICFKEWIARSRPTILAHSEKIFMDHVQSHESLWTEGDFRRWVLSQHQWTIHVELRGTTYNVPLNLLSLFGIVLEKS